MIAGVGVDIVKIGRIKTAVDRWGEKFMDRVFTEDEKNYSLSKYNPYPHLAARFAYKEALAKALGTGFGMGIKWKDIELIRNENGKPEAKLNGTVKELADRKNIKNVMVSISHDTDYAIAYVTILN
ncbi:MAG TPA: ACP synthase [Nitrospinae bacterium]|nr:ACP synthase [Nitrospinota bacterium]HBA27135.1 ACP synthase [Nitrospinota bacterium]